MTRPPKATARDEGNAEEEVIFMVCEEGRQLNWVETVQVSEDTVN